jgi:hypothetical protein
VATKNVHFVKGTLLEYDGIFLAEGPWPGEAYEDAAKREATRGAPRPLNYASSKSPRVSVGPHAQHIGESMHLQESPVHPRLEEIHPLEIQEMAPPNGEQPLPMPSGDNLPGPESEASATPQPAMPSTESPALAIAASYVAPDTTQTSAAESTQPAEPPLRLPPNVQP